MLISPLKWQIIVWNIAFKMLIYSGHKRKKRMEAKEKRARKVSVQTIWDMPKKSYTFLQCRSNRLHLISAMWGISRGIQIRTSKDKNCWWVKEKSRVEHIYLTCSHFVLLGFLAYFMGPIIRLRLSLCGISLILFRISLRESQGMRFICKLLSVWSVSEDPNGGFTMTAKSRTTLYSL